MAELSPSGLVHWRGPAKSPLVQSLDSTEEGLLADPVPPAVDREESAEKIPPALLGADSWRVSAEETDWPKALTTNPPQAANRAKPATNGPAIGTEFLP